jgi:outer membrane receptor for ferrienterochelin and colicin
MELGSLKILLVNFFYGATLRLITKQKKILYFGLIYLGLLIFPSSLLAKQAGKEDFLFDLDSDIQIASKYKQPLSEAPSIVSVITANEIENMGARDIRDVLKRIPGSVQRPARPHLEH